MLPVTTGPKIDFNKYLMTDPVLQKWRKHESCPKKLPVWQDKVWSPDSIQISSQCGPHWLVQPQLLWQLHHKKDLSCIFEPPGFYLGCFHQKPICSELLPAYRGPFCPTLWIQCSEILPEQHFTLAI